MRETVICISIVVVFHYMHTVLYKLQHWSSPRLLTICKQTHTPNFSHNYYDYDRLEYN